MRESKAAPAFSADSKVDGSMSRTDNQLNVAIAVYYFSLYVSSDTQGRKPKLCRMVRTKGVLLRMEVGPPRQWHLGDWPPLSQRIFRRSICFEQWDAEEAIQWEE